VQCSLVGVACQVCNCTNWEQRAQLQSLQAALTGVHSSCHGRIPLPLHMHFAPVTLSLTLSSVPSGRPNLPPPPLG
jgi:hypothetical protein